MATNKKRCPKCNSSQTYYRSKDASYHCQSCGNDFTEADIVEEQE